MLGALEVSGVFSFKSIVLSEEKSRKKKLGMKKNPFPFYAFPCFNRFDGKPVGVELTGNKEMKLTANDRSEMYNWVQKLTLLIWLVL